MTLRLPPLRERREDIPFLAAHFAGEDWNIAPRAMNALQYYQWPGNVRQLINAIERAKILSDDEIIHLEQLAIVVAEYGSEPPLGSSQEAADRGAVQKADISEIMRRENGNKSRAARALGVTRRTLYRLLEKYELAEE